MVKNTYMYRIAGNIGGELNLAEWPQPALTMDLNLVDSATGICCMQCQYLILKDFNLAVRLSIRQTTKLNTVVYTFY